MKIRNALVLLLAAVMLLTLFAGCGTTADNKDNPDPSQAGVSESPSAPPEGTDEPMEIVELEMWLPAMGYSGSNAEKSALVAEKINEITEREIGVRVNLQWIDLNSIGTQTTLAIANKQPVDLISTIPPAMGSFTTYYTNGIALDISPYIDAWAPELKEMMDEMGLFQPFTMEDGGLYGVPTYRQLNSNLYACYRADVLKEAGLYDYFYTMTTWADYEELLRGISELGTIYATGTSGAGRMTAGSGSGYLQTDGNLVSGKFSDLIPVDNLADSLYVIITDQKGNVSFRQKSEAFINICKTTADWMQKGYVYPDASISIDQPEALIAQYVYAGYTVGSEFGVEANKSQTCQTEMACLMLSPGLVMTSACKNWTTIVPVTSTNPERAVQLINLIWTSPELMNLFNWGIEGDTYIVADGEAQYPEGKDATTSGYHYMDFVFGNQFLALPWKGSGGASFREDAFANLQAAPVSAYMGMTVDTSEYASLIAALSAVRDEYSAQIENGYYTDQLYDEFISKLEVAGVDEYLELFQSSMDDFLK